MASFQVLGIIEKLRYLPENAGVMVYVSEYKKGYKTKAGTIVDDKWFEWVCYFKPSFASFINGHFTHGMYVEIKGNIMPYGLDHGKAVDGYSVEGQTINVASPPKFCARSERKMIKESQAQDVGNPDLDAFNSPDF